MKTKKMYVSIKNPPWYEMVPRYSYDGVRTLQEQYFRRATNNNLVDFWQVGSKADAEGNLWVRFRIEVKV